MKTTSRFAVAAAAGLFAGGIALTPAQAADLGGDCCADLEERVAELEATTVRKGNRVMSVKLSGQVNKAILFWDDGDEENAYVVDNDISSTRFRFTGDANWKPGWKVGFALEWESQGDATSDAVSAVSDDAGNGDTLSLRQAHWWVKSDKFGKVSVGQLATASDSTAEVNLSGASVAGGSLLNSISPNFALVRPGGNTGNRNSGLVWGNLNPGDIDGLSRQDGIRYDSPTFAGFTVSGGWYEDDAWDVALRFAKQWNSVLFAAAIGYADQREALSGSCSNSGPVNASNGGGTPVDCEVITGSASILHQPTGLFATFSAGESDDDARQGAAARTNFGGSADSDHNFWYANAGIYRRFNQYGKTSLGFEYYDGECGYGGCGGPQGGIGGGAATFFGAAANDRIASTDSQTWGLFVVQHIDNAATEFYISYHHTEGDVDLVNAGGTAVSSNSFEDIDTVFAGARVKF